MTDLDGLDLEADESLRLLNEANVEFCVRSELTQAKVSIGPTVAGQETYAIPDEIARPLTVYVDGLPYANTDRETAAEMGGGGNLRLRVRGVWWLSHDADGVESIALTPVPSTAGLGIGVQSVVYPAELAEDDEFTGPQTFHRARLEYVQGVSIGSSEDDTDRRQVHWDEFERQVNRARAHQINRSSGRGGAQLRVLGVTA